MTKTPSQRLGKIKGAAFAEFLGWYAARYGNAVVARMIATAEDQFRVGFDPDRDGFGILASQWYEAVVVHSVLDAAVQAHPSAELDVIALEAAEAIMNKTLRGIYRTAFSMCVTPERYLRHVEKVWRLHYDTGQPMIMAPGPKEHRVTYHDWTSHHPLICRLNMASARPIYSAMGCKEPRHTRVGCISAGAARCESVIVWK